MNSPNLNIILNNSDILIHIFNLLNFEDQLRLAQVNFNTKQIFENIIWIENYRSLAIYREENCFEVTNKAGANRLLLEKNTFDEFIRYYGKKVQKLYTDTRIVVPNFKPFTNLNSVRCTLHCSLMMLLLKRLATSVPQLETLECEADIAFKNITPGIVIDSGALECLLQMTNLKQLCLRSNHHSITMEYKYLNQLLYKLKLQVLKLEDIRINPPKNKTFYRMYSKFKNPVQLMELDICRPDDFWKLHTRCFEKLTILRIGLVWKSIDNEDLKEISIKCPNIEILTFYGTISGDINFALLPTKLIELHVQDCFSITHELLKQILTETTIKVFTSHLSWNDVIYTNIVDFDNFGPFEISPLIHTLAIDGIYMSKFLLSLQLQHLRKLCVSFGELKDWSSLSDLLKHPTLSELHLSRFSEDEKLAHISAFPINVTSLSVEFADTPGYAFDFFLDLFIQNPDMKLSLTVSRWTWMETLKFLLNHNKCPNDLKIMQVCDFKISYKTFKRNFEMAAKKFRCAPFEDDGCGRKDTIVLCRHF